MIIKVENNHRRILFSKDVHFSYNKKSQIKGCNENYVYQMSLNLIFQDAFKEYKREILGKPMVKAFIKSWKSLKNIINNKCQKEFHDRPFMHSLVSIFKSWMFWDRGKFLKLPFCSACFQSNSFFQQ